MCMLYFYDIMKGNRCIMYILAFLAGYVLAEVLLQNSDSCGPVTTILLPTECAVTITINPTEESTKDLNDDILELDEDSEDFSPIYLWY